MEDEWDYMTVRVGVMIFSIFTGYQYLGHISFNNYMHMHNCNAL